jgi:thiosulfate/3-mercaptopyruvate sulfurtransferase
MKIRRMKGMKKYLVMLAVVAVCFYGQAFGAESDLIVDTKFVKDKIGKPGWVLVDMRVEEDYSQGHIPGAVGLPAWVSKAFADDTKRQTASFVRMEQTLGDMGINNDSHIIVYGEPKHTYWNAVMFWTMELFGCNSDSMRCTVQFYDEGVNGWKADGGTLDQAVPAVKPVTFKAAPELKRRVTAEEIVRISEGEKKVVIIDVRSANEYKGLDVRALRGGHIPKAVNIDFAKNFDATTFRMLPLDQLQGIYKDVPKSARVIVHCQTGQRASYSYLVLRALGYNDVANYGDGWRVYGSDLKLPAEDETWYDFHRVNMTIKAVKEMQEKVK